MQKLSLQASQLCSVPAQDCPPSGPPGTHCPCPGPRVLWGLRLFPPTLVPGLGALRTCPPGRQSWGEPAALLCIERSPRCPLLPPVTLPFPSQDTLSGSFLPFSDMKENKRAASRSTRTKEPLSVESGARGRGRAFIHCHEPAALRSLAPPPFPVKLPSYVSLACLFSSVMLIVFTWSHCCATNLQNFSSCKTEALYPLNNNFHPPPPCPLLSVSMGLITPGTSHK